MIVIVSLYIRTMYLCCVDMLWSILNRYLSMDTHPLVNSKKKMCLLGVRLLVTPGILPLNLPLLCSRTTQIYE